MQAILNQVRVFLSQNPRPFECLVFQIVALHAWMLFMTESLGPNMSALRLYMPIQAWAWCFVALALAQLLSLLSEAREWRRVVMLANLFFSVVVFSVVVSSPPMVGAADILMWVYAFCSGVAFLQLRFGSFAVMVPLPPVDGEEAGGGA